MDLIMIILQFFLLTTSSIACSQYKLTTSNSTTLLNGLFKSPFRGVVGYDTRRTRSGNGAKFQARV